MLIFDKQIIGTRTWALAPGALAKKVKLEDIYTYIEQWGKDYKKRARDQMISVGELAGIQERCNKI